VLSRTETQVIDSQVAAPLRIKQYAGFTVTYLISVLNTKGSK